MEKLGFISRNKLVEMLDLNKHIFFLLFAFVIISVAVAAETVDRVPEDISVAEAVALIEADRGGSARTSQIAIATVDGKRLDLVDYFIHSKSPALYYVFDELRDRPYSEFKEQVVIRALRAKHPWPSDNSWGSGGVTDPMPEPYLSVVTKRTPELLTGANLLETTASRGMLADKLEAVIVRESFIKNPQYPKPGETPDEGESTATDTPSKPGNGSSSSSRKSTENFNQPNWMNYWWLVIAVGGVALLYGFMGKLKDFFRR